jgi:hypothetical protein
VKRIFIEENNLLKLNKEDIMVKWISKINWGKTMFVAVIYTVFATIVHQIEAVASLKYYMDPKFFGLWSKLMMPTAGPPPMSFMITTLILTFVTGISLALVYYYLRDMLPQGFWKRTFLFADLLIAMSFVFFTLPSYLLFNVPIALLVSWFVSGFVILVAASYTFVKIIK